MSYALTVHGGAWNIPDDFVEPSLLGLRDALRRGREQIDAKASALEIVEAAVRSLEDDPHFDAGRGSHLNRAGEVEMDASIIHGAKQKAGAVAAIQNVRHPISVARAVMERSEHVMLVGTGASLFAAECGFESCETPDLLVGAERERYNRIRAGEQQLVREEFHPEGHGEGPLGTVGAVALDHRGDLVAATSTGGTQDKRVGRVGDTPILGAGSWADNRLGAASATGWGEGIMRSLLTFRAVERLGRSVDAIQASQFGIRQLERVGGRGGLILMDRDGNPAHAYNTPRMARGWLERDGEIRVAVGREHFSEADLA